MNIFIHRRDFRIFDNTGISKIQDNKITPIFIFDPIQIDPKKNEYFSNNLVEFMCSSLHDLNQSYKNYNSELQFFHGNVIDILADIKNNNKLNSINFNKDYSPFSKKRDSEIIEWCIDNNIVINAYEDMLLIPIESNKSLNPNTKKPYLVFTPFRNNLQKFIVDKCKNINLINGFEEIKSKFKININEIKKFYTPNNNKHVIGNRKNALTILDTIDKQKKYDECRNYLSYETTNLSAFINLGLVSIREVYHTVIKILGKKNGIINELYWRDFYYNILNYFPHVVGNSFKKKYDKIEWKNNLEDFDKWKNGETGFPVVDACMRQLNKTGFMHNRGRMIVASFLTKDLLIDWRWGEKYFATKLLDCNISANNGGWQWASGSGTDAQPYFRIFNPWSQSKNYDPECKYIKKWIPELLQIDNKEIHQWNKYCNKRKTKYPSPIIEHDEARKYTLEKFKEI